ncbi:unnamed protein product, partial [Urochloa humidicola]
GNVLYRVTKESLMERLNTNMHAASLSISKECRFFTIHGSADKIIWWKMCMSLQGLY